MNFKGNTAVITGAAVGIGRAVALLLAEGGANLVLTDINYEGLEKVKVRAQNRAHIAYEQQKRHRHIFILIVHYHKYHNTEEQLYYNRSHGNCRHLFKPAVNIIG